MKIVKSIGVFVLLSFAGVCSGQTTSKEKVIEAIKDLSEHYQNAPSLSFDVGYKYSDELTPGLFRDSLKGSFKMSKDAYWYSLDNTESVGNKDFLVMLFKDDKVMYISKPSTISRTVNPVALFDSLLMNRKEISCALAESKDEKKISFIFTAGQKYKRIEYYVSNKTGFVTRMVYIIQTKELLDASDPGSDGLSPYAIINVSFTNYQTGGFDKTELDLAKYFMKDSNGYRVTAAYDSYKIFLGSTNL